MYPRLDFPFFLCTKKVSVKKDWSICLYHNILSPVEKVRDKGRPKEEWLKDHKLTTESLPIKWLMAMLLKPKVAGPEKRKMVFNDWTSWSNAKGILANCGVIGGMYPTWTPFDIDEIEQFVGLYILNGLNISPRIEYKFCPQDEDPVNGNNLCSAMFGSDAERRFKQFRALFAVQDPMLPIPNRRLAPNHKVDPLLLHMLQ